MVWNRMKRARVYLIARQQAEYISSTLRTLLNTYH